MDPEHGAKDATSNNSRKLNGIEFKEVNLTSLMNHLSTGQSQHKAISYLSLDWKEEMLEPPSLFLAVFLFGNLSVTGMSSGGQGSPR